MKDLVLCPNCVHSINKGGPNSDIWYSHFCGFKKRELGINPSTGKIEFIVPGANGENGWSHDPYPNRSMLNKGDCANYEEMEDPQIDTVELINELGRRQNKGDEIETPND